MNQSGPKSSLIDERNLYTQMHLSQKLELYQNLLKLEQTYNGKCSFNSGFLMIGSVDEPELKEMLEQIECYIYSCLRSINERDHLVSYNELNISDEEEQKKVSKSSRIINIERLIHTDLIIDDLRTARNDLSHNDGLKLNYLLEISLNKEYFEVLDLNGDTSIKAMRLIKMPSLLQEINELEQILVHVESDKATPIKKIISSIQSINLEKPRWPQKTSQRNKSQRQFLNSRALLDKLFKYFPLEIKKQLNMDSNMAATTSENINNVNISMVNCKILQDSHFF
jgi:hypothetical protein